MKTFKLLQQISDQAKENATPLPQSQRAREIWNGISYKFANIELMSELSEVAEIASCPRITLLPGVKKWVRGVANIRGNLITIIDLAAFLELRSPVALNKRSRIIVVNKSGMMAGLLVDEVFGLRHHDCSARNAQAAFEETKLTPYINGSFLEKEQEKIILSLLDLIRSPKFMDIAA